MIPTLFHPEDENILVRFVSEVLSAELRKSDFVARLEARRFTYFARRLHFRVATLSDPQNRQQCSRLIEELPMDAADRLLRSPALCEILRMGGSAEDLTVLLEAEVIHSRDAASAYCNRWSALGNVWLAPEPPEDPLPLQRQHGRFVGPQLKCGIPIDLSLPPGVRRPSAGLRAPRLLDRPETLETVRLLDLAIDLLRETTSVGHAALVSLTSNVVLRIDVGRSTESWSASSGGAIGRTLIVNPALAGGPPVLAEFLLHEVTHSALDCAELECPLIPDADRVTGGGPISPWTGSPLTIHAYLHACVVWAVLLDYWVRFHAAHPDEVFAPSRIDYIRRGFERADTRRLLEPFTEFLSDGALRVTAKAREFALR